MNAKIFDEAVVWHPRDDLLTISRDNSILALSCAFKASKCMIVGCIENSCRLLPTRFYSIILQNSYTVTGVPSTS